MNRIEAQLFFIYIYIYIDYRFIKKDLNITFIHLLNWKYPYFHLYSTFTLKFLKINDPYFRLSKSTFGAFFVYKIYVEPSFDFFLYVHFSYFKFFLIKFFATPVPQFVTFQLINIFSLVKFFLKKKVMLNYFLKYNSYNTFPEINLNVLFTHICIPKSDIKKYFSYFNIVIQIVYICKISFNTYKLHEIQNSCYFFYFNI